jgi:hypothetical protein
MSNQRQHSAISNQRTAKVFLRVLHVQKILSTEATEILRALCVKA